MEIKSIFSTKKMEDEAVNDIKEQLKDFQVKLIKVQHFLLLCQWRKYAGKNLSY